MPGVFLSRPLTFGLVNQNGMKDWLERLLKAGGGSA
jgi:hypothetical protein